MSLNRIIVAGRITKDLELRRTQSGTPVTSFTVAVDRDFNDKSGNRETDFIDVVAWRNTAEFVCNYFTKGRMAIVEGKLQIRDWKDKDGNNRRSAEILADNIYFGDSKPTDGTRPAGRGIDVPYDPNCDPNDTAAPFPPVFNELDPSDDDGELPY